MYKRPIFDLIFKRMQEPRRFIQALLGPRQIGKTTLAMQISTALAKPTHFISADTAGLQELSWITQQWEIARQKTIQSNSGALLIIDEIQKLPNWSDVIKLLWDEDTKNNTNLSVIILGSSPWLIQNGLAESLTGRFEVIPITHWTFSEMHSCFGWSLEQYAYFGGYPGAASLVDPNDPTRWIKYINDSIIETTISRDVLLMSQVNKPVLLRRLFESGCLYSGQILSYTKILGQIHDAGNTTTLAHYIDLLAGAGLLEGLQKISNQSVRQRASSPKFAVYNTALISAQSNKTFIESKKDNIFWGRLIESMIGAHLLNSIRGTQIQLFYRREGDNEVDFVLKKGDKITALEIKSGTTGTIRKSGMDIFIKEFNPTKILLIGGQGMPLQDFLLSPLDNFM